MVKNDVLTTGEKRTGERMRLQLSRRQISDWRFPVVAFILRAIPPLRSGGQLSYDVRHQVA
jgi:hypothetical protein